MQKKKAVKEYNDVNDKRATSYDVAKLAGVSQSAVSRCFVPGASVSEKMRKKVEQAAEQLGYTPNAIARGLITNRSNMVAVILNHITNLLYPEVLYQFDQYFADKGIHILLFTLGENRNLDNILQQVMQYRVDGIVAATQFSDKQMAVCRKKKVPVIFYNRHTDDIEESSVCCDHISGEKMLVRNLIELGRKDFLILGGPKDNWVSTLRTRGAKELLQQGNISFRIIEGDYSYEFGYDITLETFSGDYKPDAIVCANDSMAIGCLDALRNKMNVKVPEEVSVVGFDGIGPALWKNYDLTTVVQPLERMVSAAVEMLIEQIESPSTTCERRLLTGQLHIGSTGGWT